MAKKFSEAGDAFEPFKMLIGAVMAMLVLAIIIGVIDYFDGFAITTSNQKFYNGLNSAVQQPDGQVIRMNNLKFKQGQTFASAILAKSLGFEESCVEFETYPTGALDLSSELVTFNNSKEMDVYAKCISVSCPSECTVCCMISFDQPLD